MNIRRNIRLFFVSYGALIVFIIVFIFGFIYGLQRIDNYVKIQNNIEQKKRVAQQKVLNKENKEKKIISQFTDYCINNDIESAYNIISQECKEEKYRTKDEIIHNFINKFFKIKICEYKIEKKENAYIVNLKEDMLITGKTNSIRQVKATIDENERINIQENK